MKRKIIFGIAVGCVVGVLVLGGLSLQPEDTKVETNHTTPLVIKTKDKNYIERDVEVQEIQIQDNLSFNLITRVADEQGTLRNYWLVLDENTEKVYETEEIRVTKYVIAKRGLNLRDFPTTESRATVLKTIPYRTKVLSLGGNADWSLIEYEGQRYFCSTEFLDFELPPVIETIPVVNGTYTAEQFKYMGVINWGGWKWTWYSEKVLPGKGLHIPGRHVDKNGYVCDANGYICLAATSLEKGTVVNTPFGKQGKVYDSGCAIGTLDVYTNF